MNPTVLWPMLMALPARNWPLSDGGRQSLPQSAEVRQSEAVHKIEDPGWQDLPDPLEVQPEGQLARLEACVDAGRFPHEQVGNQHQGEDHHHHDDE